jgi:hypothetical protein
LPFLLRPDEQHVKDANDQKHREQATEGSQAALEHRQESCH